MKCTPMNSTETTHSFVLVIEVRVHDQVQISSHRFNTREAADQAANFIADANHNFILIED